MMVLDNDTDVFFLYKLIVFLQLKNANVLILPWRSSLIPSHIVIAIQIDANAACASLKYAYFILKASIPAQTLSWIRWASEFIWRPVSRGVEGTELPACHF